MGNLPKAGKPQTKQSSPSAWRWRHGAILLAIILLAAGLRLWDFGSSPPGLNQDASVNAWNSWCLLETGKDMVGDPWPIFYSHAIGDNRTTLYYYALMPFQAIGGLNQITTRLPAAAAGILAVLLVYIAGSRMFDKATGLLAAALLTLNPWAIQLSRWGIEGSLCPMLGIATIALLAMANLPVTDHRESKPRWYVAAIAGTIAGIGCYGYWAMRLFTPALLLAVAIVAFPAWWRMLKTRKGAIAIVALLLAFMVTFGPLAYKHVTDPDGIAKRREMTQLWGDNDSIAKAASMVATRYIKHFDPDFLFETGDHSEIQSPPDMGEFYWYMLPLMLIGLGVVIVRVRKSVSARVLLAMVLVYPLPDVLAKHSGSAVEIHALRSSPGMPALILLAAVGGVFLFSWLWQRRKSLAVISAVGFLLTVAFMNFFYLRTFFGEYNNRPGIYHRFHTDLLEACEWLKPRLDQYDAVFTTADGMNEPFAITLVALAHDPARWFDEPRKFVVNSGQWEIYTRYGEMYFMYGRDWIEHLNRIASNDRDDKVLFLIRPNQYEAFRKQLGVSEPIHVIRRPDPDWPDGAAVLLLCEKTL